MCGAMEKLQLVPRGQRTCLSNGSGCPGCQTVVGRLGHFEAWDHHTFPPPPGGWLLPHWGSWRFCELSIKGPTIVTRVVMRSLPRVLWNSSTTGHVTGQASGCCALQDCLILYLPESLCLGLAVSPSVHSPFPACPPTSSQRYLDSTSFHRAGLGLHLFSTSLGDPTSPS